MGPFEKLHDLEEGLPGSSGRRKKSSREMAFNGPESNTGRIIEKRHRQIGEGGPSGLAIFSSEKALLGSRTRQKRFCSLSEMSEASSFSRGRSHYARG